MPKFSHIGKTFFNIANDFKLIIGTIFDENKLKDEIINSVQKRLFEKGETGTGVKLETDASSEGEVYSDFTADIKSFLGQPINRVTLKDTGDFYDSFSIRVSKQLGFIIILANFTKEDGHIYDNFTRLFTNQDDFKEAVLSLSEEELQFILTKYAETELKKEISKRLKAA